MFIGIIIIREHSKFQSTSRVSIRSELPYYRVADMFEIRMLHARSSNAPVHSPIPHANTQGTYVIASHCSSRLRVSHEPDIRRYVDNMNRLLSFLSEAHCPSCASIVATTYSLQHASHKSHIPTHPSSFRKSISTKRLTPQQEAHEAPKPPKAWYESLGRGPRGGSSVICRIKSIT